MELQSRYANLQSQGLGLAVVTYDSVETLRNYSEAQNLGFPLLSDEGSAIIRKYDLLNRTTQPGTRSYGIPYPGTFVLDSSGRVTSRFFEQAYQERTTVSSIMVAIGNSVDNTARTATKLTTEHLEALVYATDHMVAPGNRFSLVADITPKKNMHVYAPGDHTYQVIRLRIDTPQFIRSHETTYPESQVYYFRPLDEQVNVYEQPFQLVQEVTIPMSSENEALAARPDVTLTIDGTLEYQACDDTICYTPVELSVSWTVGWRPLIR